MLNPVFTDPNDALLVDRLSRISEQLRNLVFSTAEEYQAEVYSAVNAVLSLGISMTPLAPVSSEGPAVVGDALNNFTILNNDAQDIANELLRVEDSAASLFNLAATSQNQLRQQIREFTFASNQQKYNEDFLTAKNLTGVTANIDFNAGLATNSLINEIVLKPVYSIGQTSIGSLNASSSLANLSDGRVDTAMVWNGSTLELILTFSSAVIMNRLNINLDNYAGLEIDTMTTSPDGTLVEDILSDLNVERILIDGTSGKFSGDVIIDFPPRHVQTLRMIIVDRVGAGLIAIRDMSATSRSYSSTGQLTSVAIKAPFGKVVFNAVQNIFSPYVSITHQISYDGVQFTAINPGDVITLISSPFYYRAILERSAAMFSSAQGPLVTPLDVVASSNYVLTSTTSVPLGNNIIERTLVFSSVSGPIQLREIPMPNTLQVQSGAVILSIANSDYAFTNQIITFPSSITSVTVTYQTTSLGTAALSDRENYYTSLLYNFTFEKA